MRYQSSKEDWKKAVDRAEGLIVVAGGDGTVAKVFRRVCGRDVPVAVLAMGTANNTLMPAKRQWKQHGQSGLWMSDWLPHLATCADDLAVIRSCVGDGINHSAGICQMNTSSTLASASRPCLAWCARQSRS